MDLFDLVKDFRHTRPMYWIGITGGMGMGKSSFAKILRCLGYSVLDADVMAHKVLQKGEEAYSLVIKAFGSEILDSDANINRSKLANVVFSSAQNLQKLESISYPAIQKKLKFEKNKLNKAGISVAFYDVPLLFEKKLQEQFDKTVLVWCDYEVQISRIQQRNPSWTEMEILKRLSQQLPIEEKKKLADICIENNSDLEVLEQKTKEFIKKL